MIHVSCVEECPVRGSRVAFSICRDSLGQTSFSTTIQITCEASFDTLP
ncbi:hypothetical protein MANES_06G108750v8 [Manihot esculenta]|uniref:Uncharacterized protein n=1 Tax=Manihot esculenta TaxID=3983 RepID=A0ACB7HLB6_MANES|nr:hypothetical protein MANES_06G108750v8 [Manihot esculenta]